MEEFFENLENLNDKTKTPDHSEAAVFLMFSFVICDL